MSEPKPVLDQVNLVVRDMEATLAFYRRLGLDIPEESIYRTASGAHHVDLRMPDGFELAFDSVALANAYNRGWREPGGRGSRSVLGFRLASRGAVDELCGELASAGHHMLQPPYDAFWGARYAIVEDPDGNHVGLMGPTDSNRRSKPPEL